MIETVKALFNRDLNKLKIEIESYRTEDRIWYIEGGIANSAGNLCLHLVGNLNTYIGKELGHTDYVRDRDAEFSLKNIPRTELISKIEATIIMLNNSLGQLKDEELKNDYPVLVFDKKTSIEYMLVHLTTHLTYHLGQINYHRRLLDIPVKS